VFNISYKLLSRIPEYKWDYYTLYPDVILYNCSETRYKHLCQRVQSAPYLYYDGIELRPTNMIMWALQSIKGWLGFTNYCQAQWVDYGKKKLAYYGYTRQYDASPLYQSPSQNDLESGNLYPNRFKQQVLISENYH